jgi:hypothetical protein
LDVSASVLRSAATPIGSPSLLAAQIAVSIAASRRVAMATPKILS